jgi:hypothetical protein
MFNEWIKNIEFTDDLDGGGRLLAPIFGELLKDFRVHTLYEWCSGPAWIGFWLLKLGICKELVVSDINPKAIEHVKRTARKLGYPVRAYVSDNLANIPVNEKFDLVVSNPPNYQNIQKTHRYGYLRDDLRPSDLNWTVHQGFYRNIAKYLRKNSRMFISEVEIYKKEVIIGGELYDLRRNTPLEDFNPMITQNGLVLRDIFSYNLNMLGEPLEIAILDIGKG